MPNMNLKKLWKRKSVDITEYDPTYKVIYLGNVLTGWAKGDGCVEKPLVTLWRNYCQSSRPDIAMKVTICGSGLRAVTKEHGLTEYWAHRVTFCTAHAAYPKVFCWVYRHEGRRLRQELRCHAVLCHKTGKAEIMETQLRSRLSAALHEFRREKAIRQQARLSVVNAASESVCVPMRKLYLVTGAANYRPPMERSKSAPKLGAIEEEEEEDCASFVPPQRISRPPQVYTPELSGPCRLDSLLARLRDQAPTEPLLGGSEVALVYERVDDVPETVESCPGDEMVTFSTPNLRFYPAPARGPHVPLDPPPLKEVGDDLALLESLKVKLRLSENGEESLTSDQPESIESNSCSNSCSCSCSNSCSCSSCGDAGGEEEELEGEHEEGFRGVVAPRKGLKLKEEEEDTISEESGYSEDPKDPKECVAHDIRV